MSVLKGKAVKITSPDGTVFELDMSDPASQVAFSRIVEAAYAVDKDGRKAEVKKESEVFVEDAQDLVRANLKDKVASIIRNHFRDWFTSQDVCALYDTIFGERLKHSTSSTYLARLYQQQLLERKGGQSQRLYKCTEKMKERYGQITVETMKEHIALYQA